jgi:hypothetical protein
MSMNPNPLLAGLLQKRMYHYHDIHYLFFVFAFKIVVSHSIPLILELHTSTSALSISQVVSNLYQHLQMLLLVAMLPTTQLVPPLVVTNNHLRNELASISTVSWHKRPR